MIKTKGFTLISVLIAIMILAFISLALYSLFDLALKIMVENKSRVAAISLANQRMEMIRNLPYDSIGTVGGIPAGPIPQNEQFNINGINYTLLTQVIYIDDPFDGTLGGIPPDLMSADYKRVKVTVNWTSRFNNLESVVFLTDVAPKGIETTIGGGTLWIKVFNANGLPVPQADVHIVNNQVNPPILIDVQTNNNGDLIFPGAPPAQESYEITVTKSGYSTDYTSTVSPENPNPTKPHASVFEGQVTEISFAIDLVSTFNIETINQDLAGEWKVSNDTTGAVQDLPAVSIDSSDNYFFVWRDERTGQSRLYGQKYSINKVQQWPNDIAFTTSNNQSNARISTDLNNYSYITWQDDRNGNQDIYLQKYDQNGAEVWTGAKKVNTEASNIDQILPAVTANTSTIYIAWQDSRYDNLDIFAQKFNPAGTPLWPAEIKINSDSGSANQSNVTIISDSNNNLFLAWQDNRNGNNDIYAQKYDPTGQKLWTNDVKVNSDNGTANQNYPSLALDSSNNLYITWQDDRSGNNDIYAQKYDSNGNKIWDNDVKINTDSGSTNQSYPSLAIANNNYLFFAWQDDRNGNNDIYAQKYDSNGNKIWDNDFKINTNLDNSDQKKPRVTTDSENYSIFTWSDNRNGNYDIYAAKFLDPGPITHIPNVPLQIRGSKTIGNDPIIYKYNQIHNTNYLGLLTLTNMEWDSYLIVPTSTSYTLIESIPAQPINLLPNTTTAVILNLE